MVNRRRTRSQDLGANQADEGKLMGTALTRFVKAQCANWTGEPAEECLGVTAFGKAFRKPGKCLVIEGNPCKYFKDCVLGPEDNKYPHLCFAHDPAFEARVRKQYRQIDHTVIEASIRRCPDCDAALRPRQKFCDECAEKRRRQTRRQSQRQYRRKSRVST